MKVDVLVLEIDWIEAIVNAQSPRPNVNLRHVGHLGSTVEAARIVVVRVAAGRVVQFEGNRATVGPIGAERAVNDPVREVTLFSKDPPRRWRIRRSLSPFETVIEEDRGLGRKRTR
jgi:hypothetical protein